MQNLATLPLEWQKRGTIVFNLMRKLLHELCHLDDSKCGKKFLKNTLTLPWELRPYEKSAITRTNKIMKDRVFIKLALDLAQDLKPQFWSKFQWT